MLGVVAVHSWFSIKQDSMVTDTDRMLSSSYESKNNHCSDYHFFFDNSVVVLAAANDISAT